MYLGTNTWLVLSQFLRIFLPTLGFDLQSKRQHELRPRLGEYLNVSWQSLLQGIEESYIAGCASMVLMCTAIGPCRYYHLVRPKAGGKIYARKIKNKCFIQAQQTEYMQMKKLIWINFVCTFSCFISCNVRVQTGVGMLSSYT